MINARASNDLLIIAYVMSYICCTVNAYHDVTLARHVLPRVLFSPAHFLVTIVTKQYGRPAAR